MENLDYIPPNSNFIYGEKSIKSCLNYELIRSYQMIDLQILRYMSGTNNQVLPLEGE